MARTAELYDGTQLEFPDDTPDEVISRVAKRETLARKKPPGIPASVPSQLPGGIADMDTGMIDPVPSGPRTPQAAPGTAATQPDDPEAQLRTELAEYYKENDFIGRLGARSAKGISQLSQGQSIGQAAAMAEPREGLTVSEALQRPKEEEFDEGVFQKRYQKYLENIAQEQKTQKEIPMNPAARAAMERGSAGDAEGMLNAYLLDPVGVIAEIGVPSLYTSAPSMIGAGVAGLLAKSASTAAAAMGFGSYATDIQSGIKEGLAKKGVNMEDADAVSKALRDPKLMEEVKSEANLHAIPVAVFDAIGAKLATMTLAPKRLSPLRQEVVNLPSQMATQAATGAIGEAAGQTLAGQPRDWGQIAAEAVGELVTAPGEVAVAAQGGYRELTQERRLYRKLEIEAQQAMEQRFTGLQSPEQVALDALDPRGDAAKVQETGTLVGPLPEVEVNASIPAGQQVAEAMQVSPESAAAVAIARVQEPDFNPVEILEKEMSEVAPAQKTQYLRALKQGLQQRSEAIAGEFAKFTRESAELGAKLTDKKTPAVPLAAKQAYESAQRLTAIINNRSGTSTEVINRIKNEIDKPDFVPPEDLGAAWLQQKVDDVVTEAVRQGVPSGIALKGFLERYESLMAGRAKGIPFKPGHTLGSAFGNSVSQLGVTRAHPAVRDSAVKLDRNTSKPSLLAVVEPANTQGPRGKVFVKDTVLRQMSNEGLFKAQQVLERWLKQVYPAINVILTIGPPQNPHASAEVGGVMSNTFEIVMAESYDSIDNNGDPTAAFFEYMAHELGHAITAHIYANAPLEVQKRMIAEWNLHVSDNLHVAIKDYARTHRGLAALNQSYPDRTLNDFIFDYLIYYSPWTMDRRAEKAAFYAQYHVNMDEWFAHQFEIKLSRNDSKLAAPIRALVNKAYKVYRKLWATARPTYQPNQTFEQFLAFGKARALAKARIGEARIVEEIVKNLENVEVPVHKPSPVTEAIRSLEAAGLSRKETRELARARAGVPPPTVSNEIWKNIQDVFTPGPDPSGFDSHLDNFNWVKRWTATLLHIVRSNPHIKELSDPMGVADPVTGERRHGYLDYILKWAALRMNWVSRADERLKEWRRLSTKQGALMAQFMLDQTVAGKRLDLNDPLVLAKYPLTKETRELYEKIDGDFQAFITAMEETLVREAMLRLANNPFIQNEIQSIRKRFTELRSRPYFPLTRFGKYTVIVKATQPTVVLGKTYKPGDVIHFEAFDSKLERKVALGRIRRAFPTGELKLDLMSEGMQTMAGMPRPLLEALKVTLKLDAQQEKELDEYLYRTSPAQSFVKHLIQRKGVSGFSFDVKRAYSNYFLHGANHLARVTYYQRLAESIQRLGQTATSITGDATKRRSIQNYLTRHFDYLMKPESDWAAARAAIAVAYLGAIVKTAGVNLTQVPFVTYPHLAAIYGDTRAIEAIRKAYADSGKMYRATRVLTSAEQEAITKWVQGQPLTPKQERFVTQWSGLIQEERDALIQAQREGFIDESFAMELAAMGAGSWLNKMQAGSQVGYRVRQLTSVVMIPFQAAEKFNRRVTFMAAFRLARESGSNYDHAFILARDAVSQTQFEYAKWNRPELLRGKKGVFMMFMQFQLNMLWFLSGADPGWWRAWAILLFAAGLMGLPFADNLIDLAEWAYQRFSPNSPAFIKATLKRETAELFNPQAADLLLHGTSRYGFGLVPFADLSGSISLGRIIPGTDVVFGNTGLLGGVTRDWDSLATDMVTEAGGATTSLIMRSLQMAASNDPDTWTKIERGMPLTFVQQWLGALKWYARGGVETGSGAKVHEFDLSDPWDLAEIAGKALGFQPRSVSQAREDSYYRQEAFRYFQLRREMLLTSLYDRQRLKDKEGAEEVLGAIRKYNQEVPLGVLKLDAATIKRSLEQRTVGNVKEELGGRTTRELLLKRMFTPESGS